MKFVKPIMYPVWLVIFLLLQACSTKIPPEIRQTPDRSASVQQVREQADNYISQTVRWGGIIVETENKVKASWLTIAAFPLSKGGNPQLSDQSPGRFIAIVDEFLEPLVFSRDRRITVTGNIVRMETHNIGEFAYEYPVIEVDHHYLWPVEKEPKADNHYPYWRYDPWFYPYYYPRPYPYRLIPGHD